MRKLRQPRKLRSARLKSRPVETSERSKVGLRASPRRTLRRSMSPFGLIALVASSGRARCCRIADDADGRKGKPRLRRKSRCDVAFHIDSHSAGRITQLNFFSAARDHFLDAGEAAVRDTALTKTRIGEQFTAEFEAGKPAVGADNDIRRDHDIARISDRDRALRQRRN